MTYIYAHATCVIVEAQAFTRKDKNAMATAWNPSVAKVEMRYTWDGEEVENTLYFQGTAPLALPDLIGLGGTLYTWWFGQVKPLQPEAVTLREIYVRSMAGPVALEYTHTTLLPQSGSKFGNPLPNNVSLSISFRTALTGRSTRGRNFILGLIEPEVAANTVVASLIDDYIDAYEWLLQDNENTGSWAWVVYSQYSNKSLRTTGLPTVVRSVVVVDDTVDSQRRRLPGRGQ